MSWLFHDDNADSRRTLTHAGLRICSECLDHLNPQAAPRRAELLK
jgi:hypothetical protein